MRCFGKIIKKRYSDQLVGHHYYLMRKQKKTETFYRNKVIFIAVLWIHLIFDMDPDPKPRNMHEITNQDPVLDLTKTF